MPTLSPVRKATSVGALSTSLHRTLRGPRTTARVQAFCTGTGRSRHWPGQNADPVRAENLNEGTAAMYGVGKSDKSIVPESRSNKALAAARAAEIGEGRDLAKGNQLPQTEDRTPSRVSLCSALERVRQVACLCVIT